MQTGQHHGSDSAGKMDAAMRWLEMFNERKQRNRRLTGAFVLFRDMTQGLLAISPSLIPNGATQPTARCLTTNEQLHASVRTVFP